uniref:DUF4043 family protein n=1 Tax=Xylophilus sp. ASV27 TaxID=2795129 RepID=UPI001E5BA4D8|nr:DUF4043 family protein [Xylophilus sp. ASV27]
MAAVCALHPISHQGARHHADLFSVTLALDVSQASYFGKRFAAVGQGAKTPLQLLTDLQSEASDLISYDLLAELRMAPVEGDDVLEGKEEG